MKMRIGVWILLCTFFASCLVLLAQVKPEAQEAGGQVTASPTTDAEKKNVEEYIELMRKNVRQE